MIAEYKKLESLKFVKEKELSNCKKSLSEIRMKQREADGALKKIESDKDYHTE